LGYQIGENIAWGTGRYGTPRETMNSWLHSTGHRENILTADYKELGLGYLSGQTFWAMAARPSGRRSSARRRVLPGRRRPQPSRRRRPRRP
jgi:hypothetical protein